jgi:hypothetical protein
MHPNGTHDVKQERRPHVARMTKLAPAALFLPSDAYATAGAPPMDDANDRATTGGALLFA